MNKKIDYKDENVKARITVHPATVLSGLRRGQLVADGYKIENELLRMAAVLILPDCVACSSGSVFIGKDEIDVQALAVEQLAALPQGLAEEWLADVYEVNPHWKPAKKQETDEKKV